MGDEKLTFDLHVISAALARPLPPFPFMELCTNPLVAPIGSAEHETRATAHLVPVAHCCSARAAMLVLPCCSAEARLRLRLWLGPPPSRDGDAGPAVPQQHRAAQEACCRYGDGHRGTPWGCRTAFPLLPGRICEGLPVRRLPVPLLTVARLAF